MDKAPDAFRTISEVAIDLDVPQHVLRFWETRFAQIKPMKRSGGRRYYRPDDVDLLRGIRHLLYSEGYTIRGVQRILKEHGVKSVQGLTEGSSAAAFGAIEDDIRNTLGEIDDDELPDYEADDEDEDGEGDVEVSGSAAPRVREAGEHKPLRHNLDEVLWSGPDSAAIPGVSAAADLAKLKDVLADLVACRRLLDDALGNG
ncbi:MAG: MerR family transcriptional regulator [Nitrobacter sp. 62-13]|uniref:MerR family transcriptional regulator n=1 Tax=Nitrobacter sp. 62-13 TaxID=1895797 RepID=UPI000968FC89|nr:MerR family transcriptional regulator [Nitrobacter sp. 62-13]OJU30316.1 MAG: MerR family transcriptional regulator [Nitrobacter sp. 62-13]